MKILKNKIVMIILALVTIAIIILVVVFLVGKNKLAQQNQDGNLENVSASVTPTPGAQGDGALATISPATDKQAQSKIIMDEYSINLPAGWQQTTAISGVSAMAVNVNDNITDATAKAAGFQSYFAVSHDTLDGTSMTEYVQAIKNGLSQNISGITFTKEQELKIDDRIAYAIEAELTQEEINFKVLLVIITGPSDDAWILSFNTVKSSWNTYEELFYNVSKSFSLKK